jgi:replicative DNA helicase Mcm
VNLETLTLFITRQYAKGLSAIEVGYPNTNYILMDYEELARADTDFEKEFKKNSLEVYTKLQYLVRALLENKIAFKLQEEQVHVILENLPEFTRCQIKDLSADKLDHVLQINALISSITEIKHDIVIARWFCTKCNKKFSTTINDGVIRKPICDECGQISSVKFIENESVIQDRQFGAAQELLENLHGTLNPPIISFIISAPELNTLVPGDNVLFLGVYKKRLVPAGNMGSAKSVYQTYFEVFKVEQSNLNIENMVVTPEEEQKIKELADSPDLEEKLIASFCPRVMGLTEIKFGIIAQIFGGCADLKSKEDTRSEIHILIVGSPGCLVAGERVVKGNGAIVKIDSLGSRHLEEIDVPLLTGQAHTRDYAKVFHTYKNQPIMEIITESGKSIKGTYNHPLLTVEKMIRKWKKLDELKVGDKLAVVPWIPCGIKYFLPLEWKKIDRTLGPKFKGKFPTFLDEELAGLFGYMQGDGSILRTRMTAYFNPHETDLIPKIKNIIKKKFGLKPRLYKVFPKNRNLMYYLTTHSTDVCFNLSFLKEKRVPSLVFESRNSVVAEYLAWLFEADGTVFSKGRGKRYIGLRSSEKRIEFLRDVQILLLRFGIHSRISISGHLCIRRAQSIKKFSKSIGFRSRRKIAKLVALVNDVNKLPRSFGKQLSEKIVSIKKVGFADVYDVEIPNSHRFIANGIISHNTSKSTLLTYVNNLHPKSVYVSGKGASGVGITASVEKDPLTQTHILKAGAMVLASGGIMMLDEMDKMEQKDRSAMHTAMEQRKLHINKAGINAVLTTETSILAAANPKYGIFKSLDSSTISEEFNIPATLLSRFDLIFAIKDEVDKDKDRAIATFIGGRFVKERVVDEPKEPINSDFLRKYVSYAKRTVFPSISEEALTRVTDFYVEMRAQGKGQNAVTVTPRDAEGIIRIAQAIARMHLKPIVCEEEMNKAIALKMFALRQSAFNVQTGTIDQNILYVGVSANKADLIRSVKNIIRQLDVDKKGVTAKEISEALAQGGINIPELSEFLERMYHFGVLMRPRASKYTVIGGDM